MIQISTQEEVDIFEQTPYVLLGGEPAVKKLVDRFYELMDILPEAYTLRKMHGDDLSAINEKLFLFLTGWLGGPNIYMQKYGHPRLRARHLPFPIDQAARDEWMLCMDQALNEQVTDEKLRRFLSIRLGQVADHMINKAS